jgi:hypothetical protein
MGNPFEASFKPCPGQDRGVSTTCPFCGNRTIVDNQGNISSDRKVIVRCICGQKYKASLDAPQDDREKVRILGEYTNITSGKSGPMTVEDLSMEGIGFCDTGTEDFNVGDIVVLAFELDDFEKSRIRAKVAVRQKWGNVVGCEIIEIMEGAADFGLYILP